MKKVMYWRILALVFFILGVYFSWEMQAMAYWTTGMFWYWVGAVLSYLFLVLSIAITFFKSQLDIGVKILITLFFLMAAYWTTFVIEAGLSGF